MKISALLSIDPSLRQTVTQPTRGKNILDVIVTNLARYYQEPVIVPPLVPDKPGHGVPSDHSGVCAVPITGRGSCAQRSIMKKIIRPLPASLIQSFEAKLAAQDFNAIKHYQVDQMVESYQQITSSIFSETFPQKTIIISDGDKPWFNEKLRQIKRQRLREYEKHGHSAKYRELATSFDETFKIEREKYIKKIKIEVPEGRTGSREASIQFSKNYPFALVTQFTVVFSSPTSWAEQLSGSRNYCHTLLQYQPGLFTP